MRALKGILRLLAWPMIFVVVSWAVEEKWSAVAVVLILAFRRDVSEVLCRRHLTVELGAFKGTLGDSSEPFKEP